MGPYCEKCLHNKVCIYACTSPKGAVFEKCEDYISKDVLSHRELESIVKDAREAVDASLRLLKVQVDRETARIQYDIAMSNPSPYAYAVNHRDRASRDTYLYGRVKYPSHTDISKGDESDGEQ